MLAGEEKRAKLTAPAKKKRKKEEGEPKGVRTSYLFFCEDMREEIDTVNADRRFEFEFESREVVGDWELWRGQAHPTLGLTERAKIVGEKWKSLSEEQKQPYNDKAAADKERFQKEMDAWCAPHMPPAPPNRELMLCGCCLHTQEITGGSSGPRAGRGSGESGKGRREGGGQGGQGAPAAAPRRP